MITVTPKLLYSKNLSRAKKIATSLSGKENLLVTQREVLQIAEIDTEPNMLTKPVIIVNGFLTGSERKRIYENEGRACRDN